MLIMGIDMLSYPLLLERQAARFPGAMELPPPHSGRIYLRLVRLAQRGRETVMDVYTSGNRMRIRVTRFLTPLRETIKIDPIDGQLSVDPNVQVPIEVSSDFLDPWDSFLKMIAKEDFEKFGHDLSDEIDADHYFMFYTNSSGFTAKGITNPHAKKWPEDWLRLIHRSYGMELHPPRRLFYKDKISV